MSNYLNNGLIAGYALTKGAVINSAVYMVKTGKEFNSAVFEIGETLLSNSWGSVEASITSVQITSIPPTTSQETVLLSDKTDTDNALILYLTKESDGYITVNLYTQANKIFLPEDCSYMFSGLSNVSNINLSKFDTSNVLSMSYMFYNLGSYTNNLLLDLSSFNTENVENMSYMFYYCTGEYETIINLGNNFNTSNVTNMQGMFQSCGWRSTYSQFTLNLGNKFNTSNVTDMSYMFCSCGSCTMTSLDLGDKFDTSNVTDMSNMFYYCGTREKDENEAEGQFLNELDLGEKFNINKVTSYYQMFGNSYGQYIKTVYGTQEFVDWTVGKFSNTSFIAKEY